MVALFLAFALVGGVTFAMALMKVKGMNAEIAMLNDQVAIQQAQNLKMSNEIKRLAGVEAVYVSALNLLQEELPALEFLNSIETSLPLGVWVSSVSISPGKAIIKGNSYVEHDVVEFAKGVLDKGVAEEWIFRLLQVQKNPSRWLILPFRAFLRISRLFQPGAARRRGRGEYGRKDALYFLIFILLVAGLAYGQFLHRRDEGTQV